MKHTILAEDPVTGQLVPDERFHLRANHDVTSEDEGRVDVNLVAGDGVSALAPFVNSLETRPTQRIWRGNDLTPTRRSSSSSDSGA